jgi:predicted AlkP superfamily phosphohydrolase/phosphomutase
MGKCLIIGLDGVTFDVIKPWAAADELPVLAKLMREGAHGVLNAFPNLNSAAAWTSIITGCNPAKHGIYDFGTRPLPGQKEWQPTTALDRRRPPFWLMLNQAGRKTGIINIPITYPVEPVDGFMISGMDAPDLDAPGATHPPSLMQELRGAGIDYIQDIVTLKNTRLRDGDRLPPGVEAMIDARAKSALHLMQHHEWDALMVVFVATDRVQHEYWGYGDPASDPSWNVLRETYRLLDRYIGELIAAAGPDVTTFVLSDHGFGPSHGQSRGTQAYLIRRGLMRLRQRATGRRSLTGQLLTRLLETGRRVIPLAWQPHLARWFSSLHQRALHEAAYGHIDWAHTQAFSFGTGSRVYVNLQGRQPEGTVPPAEYERTCEAVQAALAEYVNPTTGQRLVKRVWRRDELFQGEHINHAPDLLIEWNYDALDNTTPLEANKPDARNRQGRPAHRRGTHHPNGIFVAHGPDIRRGTTLEPLTHYDIVPTLLYQQGLPIPEGLDGKVHTALFREDLLAERRVETSPEMTAHEDARTTLDPKAAKIIEKRLRDLGYL